MDQNGFELTNVQRGHTLRTRWIRKISSKARGRCNRIQYCTVQLHLFTQLHLPVHSAPPPCSLSSTSLFTQLYLPVHSAPPPCSLSSTSLFTQLYLPVHIVPPPCSYSSTSLFTQLNAPCGVLKAPTRQRSCRGDGSDTLSESFIVPQCTSRFPSGTRLAANKSDKWSSTNSSHSESDHCMPLQLSPRTAFVV